MANSSYPSRHPSGIVRDPMGIVFGPLSEMANEGFRDLKVEVQLEIA
jgi:hypothetical protein